MDGKIKKFKWPTPSADYINSLKDIYDYKEQFLNIYQQEFPVGNFYSRINNKINPDPKTSEGDRMLRSLRAGKFTEVTVSFNDLKELMHSYEHMDNELRALKIDTDLRSEPTIINMPNGLDKEDFIKNNPQALF